MVADHLELSVATPAGMDSWFISMARRHTNMVCGAPLSLVPRFLMLGLQHQTRGQYSVDKKTNSG